MRHKNSPVPIKIPDISPVATGNPTEVKPPPGIQAMPSADTTTTKLEIMRNKDSANRLERFTTCQTAEIAVILLPAAPFRQTRRKYMSKRSGQMGYVISKNNRWVGRYYADEPGQDGRKRPSVILGLKNELTRTEAKLKLLSILTELGVNTP